MQLLQIDLLPLLHCFYEAQEPSLCKLVGPRYENFICVHAHYNPVDYLAFGYFITSLLSMSSSDQPNLQLKINDEISNHNLMLLFLELSKKPADVLLSFNRKLEIEFNGTTVTIEKAKLIASQMACLSKLIMTLQRKINNGVLMYFAEMLQKNNSCLTTLEVSGQAMFYKAEHSCSEHDGLALKKMCKMNKSLLHLRLSRINGFSLYILQGLQHNTTLTHLHLSYTDFNCSGYTAQALTTLLRVNKTLRHLEISNIFTSSGSLHYLVFCGLQHNTTLVHLNLRSTGLVATEDTAQALTTMLQVNKTLKHLDLSKNQDFSDSGAYIFCQGLQHNTTLVYLNLRDTWITDKGAEYIAQALKSNDSLKSLDISHNHIFNKGFDNYYYKSQRMDLIITC